MMVAGRVANISRVKALMHAAVRATGGLLLRSGRKEGVQSFWGAPLVMPTRELSTTQDTHSATPSGVTLTRLTHRAILSVKGHEAQSFLQGMMTSDVTAMERVQFSMILSGQGRAIADVFVYTASEGGNPNSGASVSAKVEAPTDSACEHFLLDVDNALASKVLSYLKRFKLRRKISLANVSDDYACIAAISDTPLSCDSHVLQGSSVGVYGGPDPRLPLGLRAGPSSSLHLHRLLVPLPTLAAQPSAVVADEDQHYPYDTLRISLGLGEGPIDHPPNKAIPLECNLEFINGVSFQKGCYVGQELTARTHHKGVVRKRIVPLALKEQSRTIRIPPGTVVRRLDTNKKIGKILSQRDGRMLGLLRWQAVLQHGDAVPYVDSSDIESDGDGTVAREGERILLVPSKPAWWPASM